MSDKARLRATAQTFEAQIRQLRENTEARFVRAGASLIAVCERFEALEKPIGALANLAAEGEVQALSASIRCFSTALATLLREGEQAAEPLEHTLARVRHMRGAVAHLARSIRTMNIVTLNARVVVAPIKEQRDGLSVFTRDARDQVHCAFAKLEEVEAALAALAAGVEQVRHGTAALAQVLSGSAAPVLAELGPELDRFEAHVATLTARGGKLSHSAEDIRTSVAQSVMALQAGDAMRQRMDHSEAALRASCLPEPGPGLAAALLTLVRRQLLDLTVQYQPQMTRLERQIGQAAQHTTRFIAEVEAAFDPGTTGAAKLLALFTRLEGVLAEIAAQQVALRGDAQQIMAMVAQVQARVREMGQLEQRMNLIGVNAVVACRGLGAEGLPLKVIADQLRDLVAESARCSLALHRDLDDMHCAAQAVAQQVTDHSARLQAMRGDAEAQIAPGLARLRAALEGAQEAMRCNRMQLSSGLQDGLQALAAQKADLEQLVRLVVGPGPPSSRQRRLPLRPAEIALLEALRQGLSIEVERKIHDTWLPTIGARPPVAQAS